MMRTIVAILAVSPVMLHAQAKSSAQPSSTPVLQSSVVQPAGLAEVKALDRTIAAPNPVRISTGVTPPTLIYSVEVNRLHILPPSGGGDRTVVIGMTVDKFGKPEDLKVIKSTDEYTDQGVLEAVSQYRFKPATLDGTPVPIPFTLSYSIQ
jgi:TonB family protein